MPLLALLVAAPSTSPAVQCAQTCQVVSDRATRARACAACVSMGPADRAGWVSVLGRLDPVPEKALSEALSVPDWRVKRAALGVLSRIGGASEDAELIRYVLAATADDAALTALHIGAERKLSLPALTARWRGMGEAGGRAAKRVEAGAVGARGTLEVALYDQDPIAQREALLHLSAAFGQTPARVAFLAMASRPPESDEIVAHALNDLAAGSNQPAPAWLEREAGPQDGPVLARLRAALAPDLARARGTLSAAKEPLARKAAAAELGRLAPWSESDLAPLVNDGDRGVALSAARWIARGHGLSLAEYVRTLAPNVPSPWASLLGDSADPDCAATLEALVADVRVAERTRSEALEALASCGGARALSTLEPFLADSAPALRAGAVAGLALLPRSRRAQELSAAALGDPAPAVVAAALRAVGAQHQDALHGRMEALLGASPSSEVRLAAARALGQLGDPRAVPALSRAAKQDADPQVRVAAADTLGQLGVHR